MTKKRNAFGRIFEFPSLFFGKLIDVWEEQILYFKHAPGVDVTLRGSDYRFEELEKAGRPKLVRGEERIILTTDQLGSGLQF